MARRQVEFCLPHGERIDLLRRHGFEVEDWSRSRRPETAETHPFYSYVTRRVGAALAGRGDLGGAEARVIVLASTSPQRSAILTQLGIPFEVVAPAFEEEPGGDPLEHAAGKARSVDGGDRPVLGVDTVVLCRGEQLGKPADEADARRMLETLSGWEHEVVSGLCLRARRAGRSCTPRRRSSGSARSTTATSPTTSRAASGRAARARTRSRGSEPPSSSGSRATT